MKTPAIYLALGAATVLAHLPFLPATPALLNSDFALFWLQTDSIRAGAWMAFPFQQPYGGSIGAFLRALWMSVAGWLSPETPSSHLWAAASFNFVVAPVLLTWSAFFLGSRLFSRGTAALGAALVAFGFQLWIRELYGTDYYWTGIVLGCLLLGIRGKERNPLLEFTTRRLFLAALLTGFAVYTYRAALIYAVAFWTPWDQVLPELKRVWGDRSRTGRMVRVLVSVLALSALYLEVFTLNLGTLFGRLIKLDPAPHWKLSFFLLGANWLRLRWSSVRRLAPSRVATAAFGFTLGMLPEIYHSLFTRKQWPASGTGSTFSFAESLAVIGRLPQSLKTFFSGDPGLFWTVGSVMIALLSLTLLIQQARKRKELIPIVAAGGLALFAYVRVKTYTDAAPVRYLFPALPAVFVAFCCFAERVRNAFVQKRWLAASGLSLVILMHSVGQWTARLDEKERLLASGRIDQMWEIVQSFQETGVAAVLTDDYWESHPYSFLARKNPLFIAFGDHLRPFESDAVASGARRIGVLLSRTPEQGRMVIRERLWELRPLKRIGNLKLFLAEEASGP